MLSSKKWGRERERGSQWRAFKTASQWREIAMHLTLFDAVRRSLTIIGGASMRVSQKISQRSLDGSLLARLRHGSPAIEFYCTRSVTYGSITRRPTV